MSNKKKDDHDNEEGSTRYERQDEKLTGKKNVSTTEEGNDDVKDVSVSELPGYEPTPANQMTEEVQPTRVVTIQEQGIGPKDPYPTGDPKPAGSEEEATLRNDDEKRRNRGEERLGTP